MNATSLGILKTLLIKNLALIPSAAHMKNTLVGFDENTTEAEYDEFVNSIIDKTSSLHSAVLSMSDRNNTVSVIEDVIVRYNRIRDTLFKPSHSFLYIKLETGGFSGYDGRIGKLGEKVFPVLRLVVRYKGEVFDEFINPHGAEKYIDDSTKTYLELTNTLTNALKSKHGIAEVNEMFENWAQSIGMPMNNPGINQYVHPVHGSVKFNNAFIYNHLPALRRQCSNSEIDINLLIKSMESLGIPSVPMAVYASEPVTYVTKMAKYHSNFLKSHTPPS